MSVAIATTYETPKILYDILPLILSVEETARRMKVSGRWVRQLIKQKKVYGFKISKNKESEWFVFWPSAEHYLNNKGDVHIHSSP